MTEPQRTADTPVLDAPASAWVDHDLAVRRERFWMPGPVDPDAAVSPDSPDSLNLATALCHGDGRVREAALRRPAGVPGELLPLVVVRCADWAGPVRQAARKVLAACGDAELAAVAHVVLRLAERRHGTYARELLESRLDAGHASPGVREAALRHPAREVRRWAFPRGEQRWGLTPERLADAAVGDSDVVVQWRCAEAALRHAPVPPALLDRLLTARSARVRAIAVTALRRQGEPERAAGWLEDRAASVRACAQWAVRQAGGDPLAHYRAAAPGPGSVAGLGECGDATDAARVLPGLDDARPAVRAAAVRALRALGTVPVARVLPLLDDPSPAVVRWSVEALLPEAGRIPEDELVARTAPGRTARARRQALRLLAERPGLTPLRVALAQVDDPDTGRVARTAVTRWAPRDARALVSALPPAERAALDAEFTRAAPALPPRTTRFLRWITGLREG